MGPRKESFKNVTFDNSFKKLNNKKISESSQASQNKSFKSVPLLKKKVLAKLIKNEYDYISKLFDILDIASLNHGRRNISDDEDSEGFEVMDVPEKKIFKPGSKKGTSQALGKNKSFPHSIDGLKKELEEQRGKPKTYQNRLRLKGLQARLIKKKRKMEKQQKRAAKKNNSVVGGTVKLKPVFNIDGNIVSNKFDFADSEVKKEGKLDGPAKKKNKSTSSLAVNGLGSVTRKHMGDTSHSDDNSQANRVKFEFTLKTEKTDSESHNTKFNLENKPSLQQGPIFNKENKIVFSKVYLPESSKKHKKKSEKNAKKILEKIKEDSRKISELEKEDKEKAVSFKEKLKWTAALKRAGGEKVRDDPQLLKKTMEREKHKKAHSKKIWQARIDRVQKDKHEKQKKRTDNIKARKVEKKKNKMKKAIKKGSFVQL